MLWNHEDISSAVRGEGEARQVSLHFESYTEISIRTHYLMQKVVGKKIIHLGCTDHINLIESKIMQGRYLHQLLTYAAEECLGVDIDEEAIAYLHQIGITNVISVDITQPNIEEIKSQKWDYMILGEILEHVPNPVQFMKQIKANYGEVVEEFIITVPNAFGLIFAHWAHESGIESINSDHKYWFSPYTLMKVLFEAGYETKEIQMCCYETSVGILENNYSLLCKNPILLDDILIICR